MAQEDGNAGVPISAPHARLDAFTMRIFPAFVIAFGLLSLVIFFVFFRGSMTFGHFMHSLCCSYTAGFMILGIPAMAVNRRGAFGRWKITLVCVILATAIGLILWLSFGDDQDSPNKFVTGFLYIINWAVDEADMTSVLIGTYAIFLIIVTASYGILEVVTAYFGNNYHRILLSLEKPGDGKLKRTATKMFMVPDIIDVKNVTIEPDRCEGFDKALFMRLMKYTVIVGLVIASYLFLNPVFLESITLVDMMFIMTMLSLFICTLIIPVSIVHSINAEAYSDAPRPYILWKGMKNRLFHAGFYLALFLTLLWVCLFTGEDFIRIGASYIGYLLYMLLMSSLVSFIYVNSFYPKFRDLIEYYFRCAKDLR